MRSCCGPLNLPRWLAPAAVAALLLAALPADAQRRQSLSDRVAALEAKLANAGNDEDRQTLTDLVFRLGELEEELRQLRGQVENQGFELEALRKGGLDRYSDLDRRLTELARNVDSGVASGSSPNLFQPPLGTGLDPAGQPPGPIGGDPAQGQGMGQGMGEGSVGASGTGLTPSASNPQSAGDDYTAAFQTLKDGRYDESARLFNQFLQDHPTSDLAPNAQYWLGESYYVTQNYKISRETFKGLLDRYPRSDKVPDARLKLGFSQLALKQYPEAEQTLTAVRRDFPGTPVARLADARLRTMRIEGHIQ